MVAWQAERAAHLRVAARDAALPSRANCCLKCSARTIPAAVPAYAQALLVEGGISGTVAHACADRWCHQPASRRAHLRRMGERQEQRREALALIRSWHRRCSTTTRLGRSPAASTTN